MRILLQSTMLITAGGRNAPNMCGAKTGWPSPTGVRRGLACYRWRDVPMSCDAARLVNNQVIFRLVAGNLDEREQTPVFRMNS
jgi:hypothetical protein